MTINYAFAVNFDNILEPKHFGDADKFLIYKHEENGLTFEHEIINDSKQMEHGSQNKGQAIIKLLQNSGVNVLVSRQFGQNIKLVNAHFIPVVVHHEKPGEIFKELEKHKHWIEDEWQYNKSGFKLFTIKSGVLKTKINSEKTKNR